MKVIADVRNGSLISQDDRWYIERLIGRKLKWVEVPDTRHEAGAYFQADYEAEIDPTEAARINRAIASEDIQHATIDVIPSEAEAFINQIESGNFWEVFWQGVIEVEDDSERMPGMYYVVRHGDPRPGHIGQDEYFLISHA